MKNLFLDYNHLVVGDFNMPYIDWNTMSAPSTYSEMFCEAIFNRNLCPITREPTHIEGNTLDLVFSGTPKCITDINISCRSYLVLWSLFYFYFLAAFWHHLASPSKWNPRMDFSWNEMDWTGLTYLFTDMEFSSCFIKSGDTNASYSLLRDSLIEVCHKFVPLLKSKSSSILHGILRTLPTPWIKWDFTRN